MISFLFRNADWRAILVSVWVGGMFCWLAVSVLAYVRFLRRCSAALPAPESWAGPWQRLLDAHDIRRSIPMAVTDGIGPALCWTPRGYRLLVPQRIWNELTSAQRLGILRHELAHFQRGDLQKTLLVRLLALPHWFNPFAWLASRRFAECAEWACDRTAVGVHKNA